MFGASMHKMIAGLQQSSFRTYLWEARSMQTYHLHTKTEAIARKL